VAKLEEHLVEHASKVSDANMKCYSDFCRMLGCEDTEADMKKNLLNSVELAIEAHKCKDVLSSCFDRSKEKERRIYWLFRRKFCARFEPADSQDKGDTYHVVWDDLRVLRYLGFAFLCMGFVVFYCLLYFWRSEMSTEADLSQSGSWFARVKRAFSSKRKIKGY
jgi:hypothetical protein